MSKGETKKWLLKKIPYCKACGHLCSPMIACRRTSNVDINVKCRGYDERKDISVKDDIHYHCRERCLCTFEGCIPDE